MGEKVYALIETHVGKTKDARDLIKKIPGVISVDEVTGPYDLIVVGSGIPVVLLRQVTGTLGVARTIMCISS